MPYLLITNHSGVEYASVVYFDKHREIRLGEHLYIEITDEQAKMTLDELHKWHRDQVKAREEAANPETVRIKKSELLKRLSDIIEQSHHEGERENAKALYLKYAGKAYGKK